MRSKPLASVKDAIPQALLITRCSNGVRAGGKEYPLDISGRAIPRPGLPERLQVADEDRRVHQRHEVRSRVPAPASPPPLPFPAEGKLMMGSRSVRSACPCPTHSPRRTQTSRRRRASPQQRAKGIGFGHDPEPYGKRLLAHPDHCRGRGPGLFASQGDVLPGCGRISDLPWPLLLRRPGITANTFLGNIKLRCEKCGRHDPVIGVQAHANTQGYGKPNA
jgi:hypothetical protein